MQIYLESLDFKFAILALTEVGRYNVKNNAAFFKGYKLIHDETNNKKGGTALLVNNKHAIISERNDLNMPKSYACDINYQLENSWVELKVKDIMKNIIVGCIYRHPKGKVSLFTDKLEKIINKVAKENKLCYLVGDLNINLLNTNHDPTQNFINTVFSHNIIPHITLLTRLKDDSATLIDHILVQYDHSDMHDRITTGNLINDISDHLPNFILVGNKTDDKRQENDKTFY